MHSRLCLVALAFPFLLAPASHARSQADADSAELENYKLTVPVIKKLEQVQENLYSAVKANPSLTSKYKDDKSSSNASESIDEAAKKMDKVPELKAAISKAGFTTREYLVAGLALVQASMANSLVEKPGADTGRLSPGIRANMAFVKAHQAELTHMQQRQKQLDAETKELTGGNKR